MKSIIIYGSYHQGNTKTLVEAIGRAYPVELREAKDFDPAILQEYELIGLASGIDFGKFYPAVAQIAAHLPEGKRVYGLYTCARDNGKFGREIQEAAVQRGCVWLGKLGCKGFNTYGPWKLLGGMNKGHPSPQELAAAVAFYEGLLKEML